MKMQPLPDPANRHGASASPQPNPTQWPTESPDPIVYPNDDFPPGASPLDDEAVVRALHVYFAMTQAQQLAVAVELRALDELTRHEREQREKENETTYITLGPLKTPCVHCGRR